MGLFDKLESKLEQGVNGAFARAFKAEVQPVEIAAGIRRAMDDRASSTRKGSRPVVPNLFTIELSPTDYERLSAWGSELDDELIASAHEHADEQRYMPGGPLTIVLHETPELETGVFRLRPATASANDALAAQRANPRPYERGSHERYDERGRGDSYDAGRHAGASYQGSGHAPGAGGAAGIHDRGLGTRVKDYLLGSGPVGGAAGHSSHSEPDDLYDDRGPHHHEAAHHEYGDGGYAGARDTYGADQYGHQSGNGYDDHHGGAAGHPGAGFAAGNVPGHHDDASHGSDASRGGYTPRKRHAWDDDDDDYGDATGMHESVPDDEESTSAFRPEPQGASRQPQRRTMSPRERPWLKIDGQRYPLLGAITVLGRDDDADIVIDDPGVSRRHSEIRITHDGPHLVMSIRDLGSTNGTYVNGDRVESEHVHDGDRLTVGRTPMTIHLGDRS